MNAGMRSASFFRQYLICSKKDSSKIWGNFSSEQRYKYLSDLLQWDDEEAESIPSEFENELKDIPK